MISKNNLFLTKIYVDSECTISLFHTQETKISNLPRNKLAKLVPFSNPNKNRLFFEHHTCVYQFYKIIYVKFRNMNLSGFSHHIYHQKLCFNHIIIHIMRMCDFFLIVLYTVSSFNLRLMLYFFWGKIILLPCIFPTSCSLFTFHGTHFYFYSFLKVS